ncbi:MAG: LLM class flavin-dependent oxidoreductase [Actinobacteria bacterium]|nr:LLM class flavin-dependent oxidoreductase [Actinomycetota bacterium]
MIFDIQLNPAAATTRINLGSLVVNIANRNPGVTALSAASVQMVSGGRFTFGLGAGAAPGTHWSGEHRILGIDLAPTVEGRHARLEQALDEVDRLWAPDRPPEMAAFPSATPRPPVILGVNSEPLAALAGRRCDGLNVRGHHPRALDFVDAARRARDARTDSPDRPFDISVWTFWDEALADPQHPERVRWEQHGVNRIVLVSFEPHDPAAVARFGR